jgi:hypothetical protein
MDVLEKHKSLILELDLPVLVHVWTARPATTYIRIPFTLYPPRGSKVLEASAIYSHFTKAYFYYLYSIYSYYGLFYFNKRLPLFCILAPILSCICYLST